MTTYPSIPAWRIPWTEEPGGLQSGESHGQRSLAGYSPRGHRELESTERLSTYRISGLAAQMLSYRAPSPALFKPLRAVGSSVATSHLPHKGSCSRKWSGTAAGDCTLLSLPVLWTEEEFNLQCQNFSKVT